MESIDKLIEQFLRPPKNNFINLLWNENTQLQFFDQIKFTVLTQDNKKLSCHLFKPVNYISSSNTPTVIYSHAYCSSKYEASNILKHCRTYGLSLCIYDARACGESEGDLITFGYLETLDLLFLIFKLILSYKCNHFILWGRSIGCNIVLMLQNRLLSNESLALNHYLKRKDVRNLYPSKYNDYIKRYYPVYLKNNEKQELKNISTIYFQIIGLVLDVPYYSFNSFIKDNVNRFIKYVPGFVTKSLSSYVIDRILLKYKINLLLNQNKTLLKLTNINTVMIISDKDEIVPYKRFDKMKKNFAEKFIKKNILKTFNCGKEHGVRRDDTILHQVFHFLLSNQSFKNIHIYEHILENNEHTKIFSRIDVAQPEIIPACEPELVFEESINIQNFESNPMMQKLKTIQKNDTPKFIDKSDSNSSFKESNSKNIKLLTENKDISKKNLRENFSIPILGAEDYGISNQDNYPTKGLLPKFQTFEKIQFNKIEEKNQKHKQNQLDVNGTFRYKNEQIMQPNYLPFEDNCIVKVELSKNTPETFSHFNKTVPGLESVKNSHFSQEFRNFNSSRIYENKRMATVIPTLLSVENRFNQNDKPKGPPHKSLNRIPQHYQNNYISNRVSWDINTNNKNDENLKVTKNNNCLPHSNTFPLNNFTNQIPEKSFNYTLSGEFAEGLNQKLNNKNLDNVNTIEKVNGNYKKNYMNTINSKYLSSLSKNYHFDNSSSIEIQQATLQPNRR